ncbi:P22 phage major capsid protein family protein [Gardnerella vaginalis]|jgi:hypothetical protein|uniref:P22 phage major capsid protein family protein n=1 Tax=Gardnerella vaginalis TaxID=2702 RepID=UPI00206B072E|nr:MAG TPA: Major capsid protein [Caudoviricetes sp.]
MTGLNNFIPEIWSANILVTLENSLVFANLANREHEGEIKAYGDTVHITGIGDIQIQDYTKYGKLTIQPVTDIDAGVLKIDQSKAFAFEVDDLDTVQARDDLRGKFQERAAYNLAAEVDKYVGGLMVTAAAGKALKKTYTKPEDVYESIVSLGVRLSKQNIPTTGRFLVVDPDVYGMLLLDDRFVKNTAVESATLHNGFVGNVDGFTVYQTNCMPGNTDTKHTMLAGSTIATTFAQQISKMESTRREESFSDLIKGLLVYGAKVIRPEALATCELTTTGSVSRTA